MKIYLYTTSEDSLGDTTGINIKDSIEKLDNQIRAAVSRNYPEVKVETIQGNGMSSFDVYPETEEEYGETDMLWNHVSDIVAKTFETYSWVVQEQI